MKSIEFTLQGKLISGRLMVLDDFKTLFDFSWNRLPVTFVITQWQSRRMLTLVTEFLQASTRDSAQFGSIDDFGFPSVTVEQKLNIIQVVVRDMLRCLDLIAGSYPLGMLDYAFAILERHSEEDGYEQYISKRICECIVSSMLTVPDQRWGIVLI
jgi:hypothetical protein